MTQTSSRHICEFVHRYHDAVGICTSWNFNNLRKRDFNVKWQFKVTQDPVFWDRWSLWRGNQMYYIKRLCSILQATGTK